MEVGSWRREGGRGRRREGGRRRKVGGWVEGEGGRGRTNEVSSASELVSGTGLV